MSLMYLGITQDPKAAARQQTTQAGATIDPVIAQMAAGGAMLGPMGAVLAGAAAQRLQSPMTLFDYARLEQQRKIAEANQPSACQWQGMNVCLLAGVAFGVLILFSALDRR